MAADGDGHSQAWTESDIRQRTAGPWSGPVRRRMCEKGNASYAERSEASQWGRGREWSMPVTAQVLACADAIERPQNLTRPMSQTVCQGRKTTLARHVSGLLAQARALRYQEGRGGIGDLLVQAGTCQDEVMSLSCQRGMEPRTQSSRRAVHCVVPM